MIPRYRPPRIPLGRKSKFMVAGLFGLTALVVWRLVDGLSAASGLDPLQRTMLETEVLRTTVWMLGAMGLAVMVFLMRLPVKALYHSIVLANEAQFAETFLQSVSALGQGELHLRSAELFSLVKSARESARHRIMVAEILAGYLRRMIPWPPAEGALEGNDVPRDLRPSAPVQTALALIQTALKFWEPNNRLRMDIARTDLRGASAPGAMLMDVDFTSTHLERARLMDACLINAGLRDANLHGAKLDGAELQKARLTGAKLPGASLIAAHLEQADLSGAHMEGAVLIGAFFNGTILSGAHLEGADLMGAIDLTPAQLRDTFTDQFTRLPDHLRVSAFRPAVGAAVRPSEA